MKNLKVMIGFVVFKPNLDIFFDRVQHLSREFCVIIIDNSGEVADYFSKHSLKSVYVRKMKSNCGAAGGARMISLISIRLGCEIVVFFDQDTGFNQNSLGRTIEIFYQSKYDICYALTNDTNDQKNYENPINFERIGIFSGTILRVAVIERIGCYKSVFFMEGFDIEYSLRSMHKNIQSCQIPIWRIEQCFGSGREIKFIGRKINLDDHLPWRYYYRGRGLQIIFRTYFREDIKKVLNICFAHLKSLIKVILFEKAKKKKLSSFISGVKSGVKFVIILFFIS